MKILLSLAALCLCVQAAQSQNYNDIQQLRDQHRSVRGLRPMVDAEHYTLLEGRSIFRYSYAEDAPGKALLPVVSGDFRIMDYLYSPDGGDLLLSVGSKPIYRHSFTTNYYMTSPVGMRPIMVGLKNTRDASFSPNGEWIAVSSNNDLWLYNIETQGSRQITQDGEWNKVINGTTDWVYEEEFGFTKGYSFSPDSRQIAYLRFDESQVPLFEMMRFDDALYNKAYSFKYPKAGDANSTVQLWLFDIQTGQRTHIDTGPQSNQYIPHIGWTPGGELYFYRLNRLQKHLEVVLCRADGSQQVIYDEQSPRYVERASASTITFIDADRFIAREETSTGWMHLYLHSISKGRLHPITKGNWEVTELVATTGKKIFYLSTETSPLRRNLYSIDLNGRNKRRLTTGDGVYSISPGKDMKYYISTFSNTTTPNRVEVCRTDGSIVRTMVDNAELHAELEGRPVKEFFTFTTERGDTLNGWTLRPRNFDPSKRYPVLLTQYSGPGSQQVLDRWAMDWENAIADAGYVVVCADGRGTGARGEAFKKCTYANLGALEVEDQISLARYMASQPYIDATRIGIYGWSFGGFMALNCALKSEGLFKMAIAVAPVSSWRYYDTIYTEIYNGLPQDNPQGYDDNSPIKFAAQLDDAKTRLLIIHGTADDNVHVQNAMEMARALNAHKKQYDMMIYPDQNHSMMPDDMSNVRQKMVDYTLKNL